MFPNVDKPPVLLLNGIDIVTLLLAIIIQLPVLAEVFVLFPDFRVQQVDAGYLDIRIAV